MNVYSLRRWRRRRTRWWASTTARWPRLSSTNSHARARWWAALVIINWIILTVWAGIHSWIVHHLIHSWVHLVHSRVIHHWVHSAHHLIHWVHHHLVHSWIIHHHHWVHHHLIHAWHAWIVHHWWHKLSCLDSAVIIDSWCGNCSAHKQK